MILIKSRNINIKKFESQPPSFPNLHIHFFGNTFYYSGREAPSLKMGFSFFFFFFFFFFGVADFALWTLIGSRLDDTFFVVCLSRVRDSTQGRAMCALLNLAL